MKCWKNGRLECWNDRLLEGFGKLEQWNDGAIYPVDGVITAALNFCHELSISGRMERECWKIEFDLDETPLKNDSIVFLNPSLALTGSSLPNAILIFWLETT